MTARGQSEIAARGCLRDIGKVAVISAAVLSIGFFLGFGLGIRINTSPSLPIGLYRVDTTGAADMAEFCPPAPFGDFANARGYRHAGSCRDGGSPLLKPIIAHAGDTVSVSPDGVAVNGRLLPNSGPRKTDTAGRPLSPWPFGTYSVVAGKVWVLSSYHPRSFDSRYFGPIAESAIRERLKPLLILR
jgi:conjugative transfer signal peptidase TraF